MYISAFMYYTWNYQSFGNGFEVRSIFLDISKAFDKVLHKCLIFNSKQNGVKAKSCLESPAF